MQRPMLHIIKRLLVRRQNDAKLMMFTGKNGPLEKTDFALMVQHLQLTKGGIQLHSGMKIRFI